jgi:hypothetical protein
VSFIVKAEHNELLRCIFQVAPYLLLCEMDFMFIYLYEQCVLWSIIQCITIFLYGTDKITIHFIYFCFMFLTLDHRSLLSIPGIKHNDDAVRNTFNLHYDTVERDVMLTLVALKMSAA